MKKRSVQFLRPYSLARNWSFFYAHNTLLKLHYLHGWWIVLLAAIDTHARPSQAKGILLPYGWPNVHFPVCCLFND